MKIKFVGPKPLISSTGIDFDNNKEDKHVYINIAVQLLKALDHDFIDGKKYSYDTNNTRLSDDELMDEIRHYCPHVDRIAEEREAIVVEEVEHELTRAHENTILDASSQEALINNLKIMKSYQIQRAINKAVYYCAVNALAEIVKRDHIDFIVAPMFQKFAHVFHSIQGVLNEQKFPIDTNIEIYEEDGKLLTKLQVENR